MEKTFEELIEGRYFDSTDGEVSEENKEIIKELMQQVREATKAECEEIAFNNLDFQSCEDVRNDLYNLPTDRIILTDK